MNEKKTSPGNVRKGVPTARVRGGEKKKSRRIGPRWKDISLKGGENRDKEKKARGALKRLGF